MKQFSEHSFSRKFIRKGQIYKLKILKFFDKETLITTYEATLFELCGNPINPALKEVFSQDEYNLLISDPVLLKGLKNKLITLFGL